MFKTRDLTIEKVMYGGDKTGRFYNYSEGTTALPSDFYTEELMSQRYKNSPRINVLSGLPYQLGKESFSSTENKRPLVNYCEHRKDNYLSFLPHSRYCQTGPTVTYWWGSQTPCHHQPYWLQALPSSTFLPSPVGLLTDSQSAARRAWWTMQPRFKGDSNLLMSLIELKDFRDIAHHLVKAENKLWTLGFNPNKGLKPKRRSTFSPIGAATNTVASGILCYNFAIAPLLSDIANLIADAQKTALDAQSQFMENGTKPHTVHYSEILKEDFTIVPWTQQFYNVSLGFGSQSIFTASMERKYNYVPRKSLAAFVQYYGLNFTWETMWQEIPFTFLADYILNIGKSIRAMETDPNVDPFLMTYYESLLMTSRWGAWVYHPNGAVCFGDKKINTSSPRFVSGYENSYYQRYPARPNYGPALPNFAKYRDRKLLNCIALARVMF